MRQRIAELEASGAERKRAEATLRQRNRALALLNRVGQELAATLDLQQVIEQLLQAGTEIIGADGASVWLWDEEREGWLVCQAASSHGQADSLVNLRLRPGQGVAGWVAQHEESAVVSSAPDDPRFFPGVDEQTKLRTTSLLAVPLRVRGAVVGVLEIVNKLSDDFNGNDLALAETLAASAAIAIDNARLVEALRQRTFELQARNEELDAFAHTVAHDLKGPLAPLVGYAETLAMDYATAIDSNGLRYLRKMAQIGRKMSSIIDELLLLAGARKMEVEMGPLDMGSIVAEAQQRLAHVIEKHQAEIILPETWPVALGYSPWVEEVWVNYLSNALKYGGQPPRVELGFGVSGPRPEPGPKAQPNGATAQADGEVRFWVRDNGHGLTPEEQARLFTPFTRFDQVRAKGHGLGLSIVRRIVEKLGGRVGVESEIGAGSTFWFTLPAAHEANGGQTFHNPLSPPKHVASQSTLEQLEHGPALPGEGREAQQPQHQHAEIVDPKIKGPGQRVTPARRGPEVPELPQEAGDHSRRQQPQPPARVALRPLR